MAKSTDTKTFSVSYTLNGLQVDNIIAASTIEDALVIARKRSVPDVIKGIDSYLDFRDPLVQGIYEQ